MKETKETNVNSNPNVYIKNSERWMTKKIRDLVIKTSQKNPQKSPDSNFKYVDISSISREMLKIIRVTEYKGKYAPSRARKQIKHNDILFSTVRPYLKQVAMVPEELDGQICSTGFCLIRCNPDFADPNFIFQYITTDSFIQNVSILQTGSNYPAVTDKDIFDQSILCPPLLEQQKIAKVLSTVDESIEKTGEIIAQVEILKQGLMQAFFVKQAEKKKWRNVKLGDYTDLLTGYPFKSELFSESPLGIKLVRGDNITNGRLRWGEKTRYWREMTPDLNKYLLKDKDILIPMDGSLVGKNFSNVVENDLPLLLVQRVARLRTKDDLLPEFLYFSIANSRFSAHVDCVKTVAAIPHISAKDIKEYRIPLPPPPKQQKIAEILSSVDEKLESERKHLEQLKILKKGMMQDLLAGRVRVEVSCNA
ncbi:MAG: restriction endonuclease subunit S [Methanosarcinaceae archaeon]